MKKYIKLTVDMEFYDSIQKRKDDLGYPTLAKYIKELMSNDIKNDVMNENTRQYRTFEITQLTKDLIDNVSRVHELSKVNVIKWAFETATQPVLFDLKVDSYINYLKKRTDISLFDQHISYPINNEEFLFLQKITSNYKITQREAFEAILFVNLP
jgi:hypothetical protein